LIATNDTSFIGGDAYVRATLIAQTAKDAQVGIHPTNPMMREPQIMAAFMASIDAMTEGRAFLDIASGDSAVYNIGLAPASRARMADYITCVRDLISTGEGTYDGRPQRVRWHGEAVRKRIPITLCAEGPKTLIGWRVGLRQEHAGDAPRQAARADRRTDFPRRGDRFRPQRPRA
jgi:alkanesulfonate monooxygenase SsuD/methylene tetrahydromethanopterin reductase-like flavin-dependent oxidoreductase (luciferase family)